MKEKVKGLLKKSTLLEVKEPESQCINGPIESYFGGVPYMGESFEWPYSEDGDPLVFVLQVVKTEENVLPKGAELIQFFLNTKSISSMRNSVCIYLSTDISKSEWYYQEVPKEVKIHPFCPIQSHPILSLPDWETIHRYYEAQYDETLELDKEEYDSICRDLGVTTKMASQLGGYPQWLQGDEAPENTDLLLQIDSEEYPEFHWVDMGLIYLFLDHDQEHIHSRLQFM
ncbi:DUF1963 domain-containing protein [Halosquirtibacter laminarini]|uniref:DUF1963 domain-containing protein n=1 Tax=Halosquirtibacter laminarini TaxID=3374600 RepID=A0AC61NKC5_9BACT|nr:DUF1963 domain-containing protein [Prolixibacteraceae bacterium]